MSSAARTIRRLGVVAATLVASAATSAILANPAHAGEKPATPQACIIETIYDVVGRTQGWIATDVTSIFVSAPGTASLGLTTSADVTATVSASFSVSVSGLIASASAEVGVSFATSVGRSQTWTYSKSFGGSTAQRAVVAKRGEQLAFQKVILNPNCTTTTFTNGTAWAPYSSTASSEFCMHLDAYPASTWESTTGGCYDQS